MTNETSSLPWLPCHSNQPETHHTYKEIQMKKNYLIALAVSAI
jgi:hypothetical protein